MNVTDRVRNILRASELARNYDRELLLIYMEKSGMELTERQKRIFREMPSFETIRRIRQKIQEEGHFLPNVAVGRARKLRGYVMRQNIVGAGADKVERIIQAPQVQELLDWVNKGVKR